MGKINMGRLILGGIVAGIVSDLLGYVVDGVLLAQHWANGMKGLGHDNFSTSALIGFNVIGLVTGFLAVWVYTAIRPRFGAGMGTAVLAAVVVWIVGSALPNAGFMVFAGLFSKHLALYTTLGALVEIMVGTVAGAALYKED